MPPITGANNLHLALDSGCPGLEADPALGPLADNGGPTRTRAPAPDSPALDRFACSGVDQRSVPRPFGALCDIGAYERAAPLVGAVTATALTTATTATLAAPVNPNARATTVTFDFGPTVEYGKTTPPVSLAAGIAPETASAAIAGLTPGTTYHVRARATNADGSAIGPDRTFEAGKLPVNQAPVVSRLAAVPSTFAVARGRTAISAARAGRRRCRAGRACGSRSRKPRRCGSRSRARPSVAASSRRARRLGLRGHEDPAQAPGPALHAIRRGRSAEPPGEEGRAQRGDVHRPAREPGAATRDLPPHGDGNRRGREALPGRTGRVQGGQAEVVRPGREAAEHVTSCPRPAEPGVKEFSRQAVARGTACCRRGRRTRRPAFLPAPSRCSPRPAPARRSG